MKLTLDMLRTLCVGAVEVEENEKGISFHRFTKEQRDLYMERNMGHYKKALSPSGVKLSFRTDSKKLCVKAVASEGSSRKYFSLDLFLNGEKKDSYDNFSHMIDKPVNSGEYPQGAFEYVFDLGEGEKDVVLYFPWAAQIAFLEISVDDGAKLEAVKPSKKMLCFGDSITQGYDAAYSCNSYIARLARFLGVEEYNKAIGGEVFWPGLAATKEPFDPDLITVAYGTNDWSKSPSLEVFKSNCKGFYENLSRTYPNVPIFAISPIWRKAYLNEKPCGAFTNVHDYFVELAKTIPNMTVICGWDFVPHDSRYFCDGTLHPNDEGFAYYAEALYREIQKYL